MQVSLTGRISSAMNARQMKKPKPIAIYGMGKLGQLLRHYLTLKCEMPVYSPNEKLPKVDVVIITVKDFYSVKVALAEKVNVDIIHITDLLFGNV